MAGGWRLVARGLWLANNLCRLVDNDFSRCSFRQRQWKQRLVLVDLATWRCDQPQPIQYLRGKWVLLPDRSYLRPFNRLSCGYGKHSLLNLCRNDLSCDERIRVLRGHKRNVITDHLDEWGLWFFAPWPSRGNARASIDRRGEHLLVRVAGEMVEHFLTPHTKNGFQFSVFSFLSVVLACAVLSVYCSTEHWESVRAGGGLLASSWHIARWSTCSISTQRPTTLVDWYCEPPPGLETPTLAPLYHLVKD